MLGMEQILNNSIKCQTEVHKWDPRGDPLAVQKEKYLPLSSCRSPTNSQIQTHRDGYNLLNFYGCQPSCGHQLRELCFFRLRNRIQDFRLQVNLGKAAQPNTVLISNCPTRTCPGKKKKKLNSPVSKNKPENRFYATEEDKFHSPIGQELPTSEERSNMADISHEQLQTFSPQPVSKHL